MEVCVCKYCGRLFNSYSKTTKCSQCSELDTSKFKIIEQYLIDHPGSNAIQVASGLNIKVSEILEYINEGRLVVIGNRIQLKNDM